MACKPSPQFEGGQYYGIVIETAEYPPIAPLRCKRIVCIRVQTRLSPRATAFACGLLPRANTFTFPWEHVHLGLQTCLHPPTNAIRLNACSVYLASEWYCIYIYLALSCSARKVYDRFSMVTCTYNLSTHVHNFAISFRLYITCTCTCIHMTCCLDEMNCKLSSVHLPQNDMMIAKNKVPPLSNNWFTCK